TAHAGAAIRSISDPRLSKGGPSNGRFHVRRHSAWPAGARDVSIPGPAGLAGRDLRPVRLLPHRHLMGALHQQPDALVRALARRAVAMTDRRDWWVVTGMATAASSAALASFAGLRGLAAVSGWPTGLAWLLPITIDAHAMTSARVWLAASTKSETARRFAR